MQYSPRLIETIRRHMLLEGSQVLEVGVGTGGNSATLAKMGARVTAIDFANSALARTRASSVSIGVDVNLVHGDTLNLPFRSGQFDLVFHQGLLEHFVDPVAVVREQKRVLRRGGFVLVDVPQRFNLYTLHKRRLMRSGRWPYGGWEREFSFRELTNLLSSIGLQIVAVYGRGYYPRPLEMVRNLQKVETKILRRKVLRTSVWKAYDQFWRRFEESNLGCNLMQCIGVLALVE